jgi:glycine oxidase
MTTAPDVVVIGGGVIGCAVARQIAARGATVELVERDVPGRAATWAAGGMLSPLGEAGDHPAFLDLAAQSLDRYAQFVSELAAQTGIDVEYMPAGKLHVMTGGSRAELDSLIERGSGFGVHAMTGAEARSLEPALGPAVNGAVFVGRDHRVNNRLLGVAAWKAAEAGGVRVRCDSPAASLDLEDRSVHLADGTTIATQTIVIAAGAWSAGVEGLPRTLPVEPVRGQMLAVEGDRETPLLERVIHAPGCYLIPREEGHIVIGATSERAGFAPGPTPAGLAALSAAAAAVVPAIAERRVLETWSGFRPGTPDGLPVLGPEPQTDALFYATGHYRNGILLAPITAEILAACIAGEPSPVPLEPFRPDRFEAA